jgi:hypothetical protein
LALALGVDVWLSSWWRRDLAGLLDRGCVAHEAIVRRLYGGGAVREKLEAASVALVLAAMAILVGCVFVLIWTVEDGTPVLARVALTAAWMLMTGCVLALAADEMED